jgi:hypothetical protein
MSAKPMHQYGGRVLQYQLEVIRSWLGEVDAIQ